MTVSCELRLLQPDVNLLALHNHLPSRYPYLLESSALGSAQGRYDLLLAAEGAPLVTTGDGNCTGPLSGNGRGFLAALDKWYEQDVGAPTTAGELPFAGGWFLYLGYELAAEIEPKLVLPMPDPGVPVAVAARCPAALVRDHALGEVWAIAERGREDRIRQMLADVESLPPVRVARPFAVTMTEDDPAQYREYVHAIREYILAGDVFQVNISRGWTGRTDVDPARIYAELRRANPAPFAGIMRHGDYAVISSSPERLIRRRGEILETRPIAGTHRRGGGRREDDALSLDLMAHPKERAEHIMLIDLERNDLGRLCRPGTVEVNEMMVLESYAHVHHIVSNVRGIARPGLTPGATIAAVFPGGTITGCPKVRCMEIIAELEQRPRGAYTGTFGYLDRSGDMDLNILIRTLTLAGDQLELRAGGGIVADSDPARELAETRHKARGLLRALRGPATG